MKVPALQVDDNSSDHEATDTTWAGTPTSRRPLGILASWIQSASEALLFYFHHPVFIPSISLSLLYFTVLSFSGQMVTYLLTVGYDSSHIGVIRTVSVLFEMSATWIAPKVMAKIGPIRAGIWFISWQTLCVLAGLCFFWGAPIPLVAASGLVGGVIASRVGLWGFDMCVQIIIQEVSTCPDQSKIRCLCSTAYAHPQRAGSRAQSSGRLLFSGSLVSELLRALLVRIDHGLCATGAVPLPRADELGGCCCCGCIVRRICEKKTRTPVACIELHQREGKENEAALMKVPRVEY